MRSVKENFANFFESPSREGLREMLINNFGEQDNLDFKAEFPNYSKLAKHILSFANSGGGCIIVGVSEINDELVTTGLKSITDKADIEKSIRKYLPKELKYEVLDFIFSESEYNDIKGKKFQVIFIDYNPKYIPFISLDNGDGIKKNSIYIRRGTNSEEVDYQELQKLLNERIETQYSSGSELELEEHLAQLKILYSNIEEYHYKFKEGNIFTSIGESIMKGFGERLPVLNPSYPDEDFDEFISRAIERKKGKIEFVLEIK